VALVLNGVQRVPALPTGDLHTGDKARAISQNRFNGTIQAIGVQLGRWKHEAQPGVSWRSWLAIALRPFMRSGPEACDL
jgi:hypothetical protein